LATFDIYAKSTDGKGPAWVYDSGGFLMGCSGINTLANIVVKNLFTTRGSIPTSRSEGTYLPNLVGNVSDMDQARAAAVASVSDTEAFIKRMQLRSPAPADETLSRLVLGSINLLEGPSLVLRVLIYNASGDALPVEVTV
jgi:hypothetical protein